MVVIKRDGSREKFDASKLNKWAEWASEIGGKYVDWTEIVLTAASRMPNEVTSKQIQELLIQTCLDNNSWSHNLMGGRLYAALTFKEFYDNKIPTVKELHDKLYELDLMVKLDYSDEEYEKIEKFINHELDYKSSYSELQHIRKKYSIQNRVEHKEYESQQFVYMRMAMALSENEKHDRLKTVKGFYDHLSAKRINAPTPNYVNLGTRKKGFASCLVYTTNDTAKSLAVGDHIAYMMTCQSAGIGSHLNTRSLGDPVNGGLIKHQGKLPYYKALDGAVPTST
jgi:ribonucleoside-diphosphate reductase alpha chain